METIEKEYKGKRNKGFIILGIGCLLIAFMPLLFSRPWELFNIGFSKTGEIGDTIGGISAPFVGLLGAILVYISFIEQWKANRIQAEQFNANQKKSVELEAVNLIWNLYNIISDDLNSGMHNKLSAILLGDVETGTHDGINPLKFIDLSMQHYLSVERLLLLNDKFKKDETMSTLYHTIFIANIYNLAVQLSSVFVHVHIGLKKSKLGQVALEAKKEKIKSCTEISNRLFEKLNSEMNK